MAGINRYDLQEGAPSKDATNVQEPPQEVTANPLSLCSQPKHRSVAAWKKSGAPLHGDWQQEFRH